MFGESESSVSDSDTISSCSSTADDAMPCPVLSTSASLNPPAVVQMFQRAGQSKWIEGPRSLPIEEYKRTVGEGFTTIIVFGRKTSCTNCPSDVLFVDVDSSSSERNAKLDSRLISRLHAEVRLTWASGTKGVISKICVKDLNSRHGTYLNGCRLLPLHSYRMTLSQTSEVLIQLGKAALIRVKACGVSLRNNVTTQTEAVEGTLTNGQGLHTHECRGFDCEETKAFTDGVAQTEALAPPTTARPRVVNAVKRAAPGKVICCDASPRHQNRTSTSTASASTKKKVMIIDDDDDDAQVQPAVATDRNVERNLFPACHGTTAHSNTRDQLTIVTTGTRLTQDEKDRCERLLLRVNPPLSSFCDARYLIVEPPLARSVKLLSAIPFVEACLHRSWLDVALGSGRTDIPISKHLFTEPYTRRGIEATNQFRMETLMTQFSPAERQQLWKGRKFFVHPEAKPQDEPSNDLKYVILASGGSVCAEVYRADVVLLPTGGLNLKARKALLGQGGGERWKEGHMVISVEDLFRSVLQQQRPLRSTVGGFDDSGDGASGIAGVAKRAASQEAPRVASRGRRVSQS